MTGTPERTSLRHSYSGGVADQAGLTLIELMVALALGLLITAAAVAALMIARQGFTSVDHSAQLRENARFAASLIQRIAVQAGFENASYGLITNPKDPGLGGFDNTLVSVSSPTTPPTLAHDGRSSGCGSVTDTSCVNGSDALVVRYFGASRNGAADGTMINCAGVAEPENLAQRAFSIFHVARSTSGEPTLACTYRDPATGNWMTTPLVPGVEGFQVLYGVDTLTAGGVAGTDSVADRYLTARQLDSIPGSVLIDNWRRVRTVRIGMVIRGTAANAIDRAATAASIPVLGAGFTDASDVGSTLTVAADGRVRQNVVFTVHLRNAQFAP
jgi:type IV pilus assembly protein PilW